MGGWGPYHPHVRWVPCLALTVVRPFSKHTEFPQRKGTSFFPQERLPRLHVQGLQLPRGASFS